MNHDSIDDILNHIKQGKRCYGSSEDDEFSILLSIEQGTGEVYLYSYSISHKHDVIAPTHYDNRALNEADLRAVLYELPEELFERISYRYKDIINPETRARVDRIYSSLKEKPKIVYVLFKEDRWRRTEGRDDYMLFNGLYRAAESAQNMVEYLKRRQGVQSYWKPVTLTLEGEELQLDGEFSATHQVNGKQILAALLEMDESRLARFFED